MNWYYDWKDDEDFENSIKFWICDNDYVDDDVKVRGHCHITGKYKVSAHRYCNINVKLNDKILVVFNNLKKLWFQSYHAITR